MVLHELSMVAALVLALIGLTCSMPKIDKRRLALPRKRQQA
jgi:hypothetical protein